MCLSRSGGGGRIHPMEKSNIIFSHSKITKNRHPLPTPLGKKMDPRVYDNFEH